MTEERHHFEKTLIKMRAFKIRVASSTIAPDNGISLHKNNDNFLYLVINLIPEIKVIIASRSYT